VTVKSADNPDSLRGAGLDGLVIDEAAFVPQKVWTDVLRPTLSDRRGWAMFISTPNGMNWFYDLFNRAHNEDGWQAWQLPTSCNPLIPDRELKAAARESGPRAYAQEYDAQFTDVEGAEFSGEYFTDAMWFDDWPENYAFRLLALDPSKGKSDKSDYSAFVLLQYSNGQFYLDADLARRDYRQIQRDAVTIARWFRPSGFCSEINQFQEILHDEIEAELRNWGVMDFQGCDNRLHKRTRIRRLNRPLAEGLFRFKAGSAGAKLLVDQLRGFPIPSIHDDGPDALEMAYRFALGLLSGELPEATGPTRIYA
jgi:predicted phage terminase large subunit-like protein